MDKAMQAAARAIAAGNACYAKAMVPCKGPRVCQCDRDAKAAITTYLAEPDEERVERVARIINPLWFGDSGRALSNFAGQDEKYQAKARETARAAIKAMSPDGG